MLAAVGMAKQKAPIGSSGCTSTGAKSKFQGDRDGALLGYRPREALVKMLPSHLGPHSDIGGQRSPPARREPPFGRPAVKRPLGAILTFPLGRRALPKVAPAGPAGKGPATQKPAPNAGVRRVQLHPSRISLSA
ncbi:hypothetical protein NDU88_005305 [Pleurodeles waltl]|uniref:Uncharacterized protein n=1 Tax=Pleurodeles waltl TaxID=8319 RepID=A0AAV7VLA4_PLEWA|nr:hypothetical protein NDU88_005305 [Pleurodeles waltl]